MSRVSRAHQSKCTQGAKKAASALAADRGAASPRSRRRYPRPRRLGLDGRGSYGAGLARLMAEDDVKLVEVARPNRQVRRQHGKSDVIDAIAAARAVLSGEATATPKTHDGPIEGIRARKVVQRSANKSRTQAINQLRALSATAPPELRERLRHLKAE